MPQKSDILWKGILEDVFDDFLRFLYPDADKLFDFKKPIAFLDKELEQLFPPEDDLFAPKIIDKLAKVHTHSGEEEWILVHVEVQGQYNKDFGKRMFEYFYRILDKYGRRITAWAIFTENSKVIRPNTFMMEYLGTSLRYQFNTYQIAAHKEDDLLADTNPFALVILTAKAAFVVAHPKGSKEQDAQLLKMKLMLARKLFSAKLRKTKIKRLLYFLRHYVSFENSETSNLFEKEIRQITGKIKNTMGIEELLIERAKHYGRLEGEAKGEAKGKAEGEELKGRLVVENLISEFGFNDEQAAKAAGVSLRFVKKIRGGLKEKKQ